MDMRRRGGRFLSAVSLLALSFAWATGATAAEGGPGEPKKQEEEATLFPVPDYTGDLWERPRLTGDWGGLRRHWLTKASSSKWTPSISFSM
jgi:hypothetical protein